jgi:hypothetical protein
VKFITDDNFRFTPAGIPTIKNSRQLDEQNARLAHKPAYPAPAKADSVNWSMVILVIVLVIILGAGIFGVYYYTTRNTVPSAPVAKDTVIQTPLPLTPPAQDTVVKDTATSFPPSVTADSFTINSYRLVIGSYPTKERAERRVFNLTKGGNVVEMVKKDTANFLIISTVTCMAKDTAHVIDSMRRMFGYRDVVIYKPQP